MQSRYHRVLLQLVALVIATSCGGDGSDDMDGPLRTIPASNDDEQAIADLAAAMQRELDRLRTRPLSGERRARIDAAEIGVRRALRTLRAKRRQGQARGVAMGRIGGISAALLADDATGFGLGDNGLLIVCGIAAVITVITTDAAATERELQTAWRELHSSLLALQDAIADVTGMTSDVCEPTIDRAYRVEDEADAESSELTDTLADTARRYGPNQKCSDDVLDTLQGKADTLCKANGRDHTCSPRKRSRKRLGRLRCSEVLHRQAKHQACLAARLRVQERCFHETDAGHSEALGNAERAIEWCRMLAAQQCAANSPYNDR